ERATWRCRLRRRAGQRRGPARRLRSPLRRTLSAPLSGVGRGVSRADAGGDAGRRLAGWPGGRTAVPRSGHGAALPERGRSPFWLAAPHPPFALAIHPLGRLPGAVTGRGGLLHAVAVRERGCALPARSGRFSCVSAAQSRVTASGPNDLAGV